MTQDKAGNDSLEDQPELKPALLELGTTPCPVCKRRVTVFVTKTKRPFINCGFCSARVFYNGSTSIRRLKRQMKTIKKG
jgi:DNA-directed RNA polymerase subunit RPC12/RpoP